MAKKPVAKAKVTKKKWWQKLKQHNPVKYPAWDHNTCIKDYTKVDPKKPYPVPYFTISANGWQLQKCQRLADLDTSFTAFQKTKQAGGWNDSVQKDCKNSAMMKTWVVKLVMSDTADDIKFSKWFWKGAIELNDRIGNGIISKFGRFIGKKLVGAGKLVKKLKVKVKKALKKTTNKINIQKTMLGKKLKTIGDKIKAGAKKIGAKIKAGAKKTGAAIKKAGAQIKAGAKATGAAIKNTAANVTAGLKVKVNAKPKVTVKVHTKKRRLQTVAPTMIYSPDGVNLANFVAGVTQPTALAGDGQSNPSKSWMMFAGLMTFVALLFN